jgi:hypothetical protein
MSEFLALQQIAAESLLAIGMMCCIATVDRVFVLVLGPSPRLLGIPARSLFDAAHLAIVVAWVLRCIIITAANVAPSWHSF